LILFTVEKWLRKRFKTQQTTQKIYFTASACANSSDFRADPLLDPNQKLTIATQAVPSEPSMINSGSAGLLSMASM
jgi:hypothetical protein